MKHRRITAEQAVDTINSKSTKKVFLKESEIDKIKELDENMQKYQQLTSQIGDMAVTMKVLEQQALQLKIENSNEQTKLQNLLAERYGAFTIGENYEVIKMEG